MSILPGNRPQTGNNFLNENGHRLHFRVAWNNFATAKYVVFNVHGYSGHTNGPTAVRMMNYMNDHNCVVVAVDMQGHGYSEGERCLMLNYEDMMNDVLQFISCFVHEDRDKELTFDQDKDSFRHENLVAFRKLPFFLMGSSMGGALSTVCSHALYSQQEKYPMFRGAILLAPALSFKTPNWLVVETLR